jgi:hypothetical protein
MATGMKIAVFWGISPCIVVDVDQCFIGDYIYHSCSACSFFITVMKGIVISCEALVTVYQTAIFNTVCLKLQNVVFLFYKHK